MISSNEANFLYAHFKSAIYDNTKFLEQDKASIKPLRTYQKNTLFSLPSFSSTETFPITIFCLQDKASENSFSRVYLFLYQRQWHIFMSSVYLYTCNK